MTEGMRVLLAVGMAVLAGVCALPAAEGVDPSGIASLRGNAAVLVGGEIRVDYVHRSAGTSGAHPPLKSKTADLSVKNANLRIVADVHPNVRALFKLDLSADSDSFRERNEVFEEAMLVMKSVGGTGAGLFAGKGPAPYGQDITLGIIQSYHHTANHSDSAEGAIFLVDTPADAYPAPGDPRAGTPLPPMRPGRFDRTFVAGASYDWDGRWRVEAAVFQPNRDEYRPRLDRDAAGARRRVSDLGMSARVWWSPIEDLVFEASGMLARSREMGRGTLRHDLSPGATAKKQAYAVSAGFDWRPGPWRFFGEYQRAWDWNFSRDYDVSIWQLGMARELGESWRVGGMAEGLRIDGGQGANTVDKYYKLAINVRYGFSSGMFVLAEYGYERFRRRLDGELADKRRGVFLGLRLGFSF